MKTRPSSKSPGTPAREHVQAYLTSLPLDGRRALKRLRHAIRAAAPRAVDSFSYGIPGFRLDGQPLILVRGLEASLQSYPIGDSIRRTHAAAIRDYETSKGTIRFP